VRLSPPILLVVALAGCATHVSPIATPMPAARYTALQDSPDSGGPVAIWDVPGAPILPDRDTSERDVIPAGGPVGGPAAAPPAPLELTRRVVDVFGDSMFITAPVLDSAVDEPTWDMDVRSYETRDRVAHYVSMFSGKGKGRLTESLERGTRYEPMIRARLKAGGLPEDMYYLALIESGFNPNAYSRAAAVGMWQFMTSTGRDLGMRIDWWVDERRDPVKSTGAAVRFIRGLRDQFGSLYLAAAAYNGGPGRVARGLAKYSDDLENHTEQTEDAFFVLAEKDYLRNETREYVPQLIAAALVAKEPVRYGMELKPLPAFSYDSVKVPGGTPLAAVAKAGGTTVAVIRDLNPHFLRGMTPPGARMQVRVPVGAASGFDSGFAALTKEERTATHNVVSRKGETVDRIAEANGISAAALETFNAHLRHLKPSGKLVTGQTLILPTPAVAAAGMHVPDPSIEKYGSSASSRSAHIRTHTVTRGETVRSIARKFDTTPERIMRLNGLRKPVLFAGQDLIVSGTPRSATGKARGKSSAAHHPASAKDSGTKKAAKAVKSPKTAKSSPARAHATVKHSPKATAKATAKAAPKPATKAKQKQGA
jgi:membrane-bound lytic murein transglycosylase D